jgi:hypothetical protein
MMKRMKFLSTGDHAGNTLARFVPLIAAISFAIPATAQQGQTYSEEITVISPYKPIITEAFKINLSPKVTLQGIEKPTLTYSIRPGRIQTTFQPQLLKPVAIVSEPITKLYRNFIKGGFGNYTTPYLEFYASSLRSKTHSFGVHLKHLSSGEMKKHPYSSTSLNALEVWATKFTKKTTASANTYYHRQMVHYYGFDDSLSADYNLSKDNLKQVYNITGIHADIGNNFDPGSLNYKLDLGYYYLFDHQETHEHNAGLSAALNKDFNFIDATSRENIAIQVVTDFYNNKDSLQSANSSLVGLKPMFSLSFNEYSFLLGLNASVGIDSSTSVHVYPVAEVSVHIIENALKAYIGVNGTLERNSYKLLSDRNPFIISTIPTDFTTTRYNLYGGINSRIGQYIDLMLQISGAGFGHLPFFVNDTSTTQNRDLNNQFTIVYDDGTRVHGKAEILVKQSERLSFLFKGNYYMYNLDNEQEAWHTPQTDLSLTGKYNIQDKFIIDAGLVYTGKSYAKTWADGEVIPKQLDGYTDINLGLEYRYNKNLSAFLQLNNLANKEYQRWNNYASHRFNFLVGLTYAF